VIIEQKIIEKIKYVLKNVLDTTQHILIVEIELLITMKTALTVTKTLAYAFDHVEMEN
jgi:hypothetical protein